MIGGVGETLKTSGGRKLDRVWIYLGVVVLAGGCVLLAVAWGLAAGKTEVALQIPYLLSAGLPAVGLVIVGVGLVVVGVRETDARIRRRQQQDLVGLLTVLRDELASKAAVAASEPPPAAPRPRRSRKAAG
jgi:hypothetical protein